ncbi:MAG: tetratricopeptide repeat protein [Xanthobacteraceae bacterium]|jgi:tetratricopeptide (TPR) repeat protein
MMLRFPAVVPAIVLAGLFAASGLTTASAQSAKRWLSPPKDLSHSRHGSEKGEQGYSLDTLFSALKIAPDDASAKAIEESIWAVWVESGSDTCDLLMTRVKVAIDAKNYDLALKLLDSIIAIRPAYVEAWNQRATVYYLKDDYPHAIADIAEVLAHEPRQFGALAGLGLMLQDIGDDKDALEAYRKALAIDPHLENIPDVVKTLSEKVEGRDI